jgi:hypothetical protein
MSHKTCNKLLDYRRFRTWTIGNAAYSVEGVYEALLRPKSTISK